MRRKPPERSATLRRITPRSSRLTPHSWSGASASPITSPTWRAMQAVHHARAATTRPTSSGSPSIRRSTRWASPAAPSTCRASPTASRWCTSTAAARSPITGPARSWSILLLDLRGAASRCAPLVRLMEQAVIDLLAGHGVAAARAAPARRASMSASAKIAALGLRVRRGCCYHGLALNVDMDLAPVPRHRSLRLSRARRHADARPRHCRRTDVMGEQLIEHLNSGRAASITRAGPHDMSDVTDKQKGAAKTRAHHPITIVPAERLKKPDWIRVRAGNDARASSEIKQILREHKLHTVCEEASCPNIGECFGKGTATFMILGDLCTRRCPFCDVGARPPQAAGCRRAAQSRAHHRRAEAALRRHHQRRSRRSARRRRAAFRRLHPRRARTVARDPHRSAGAGFPRPPRPRARHPRRRRRPT